MGDVIDLAAFRERRAGAEAPGRRHGRPYRYDPGPQEGKRTGPERPAAAAADDEDKTPA
jgi:hypothetical protein